MSISVIILTPNSVSLVYVYAQQVVCSVHTIAAVSSCDHDLCVCVCVCVCVCCREVVNVVFNSLQPFWTIVTGCLTCVENVCVDQCYPRVSGCSAEAPVPGNQLWHFSRHHFKRGLWNYSRWCTELYPFVFAESQTFVRVSSSLFLYIRPNPTVNSPAWKENLSVIAILERNVLELLWYFIASNTWLCLWCQLTLTFK